MAKHQRLLAVTALAVSAASLAGCGRFRGSLDPSARLTERECLARVMYFESNRSSDEGMLAVGTVVMNRLESPKYPKTVCGVVGQDRQFADGALSKHVETRSTSWARAQRAADAVLAGERHEGVGEAKFFHTAGYKFPYRNMKYVTLAGGNIFYEKRNPEPGAPAWPSASMFAANASKPAASSSRLMLARADIPAAAGSDNDDDRFEPAPRRPAAVRVERRPAEAAPRPVMLAKAYIPSDQDSDVADEENGAPAPTAPVRPRASAAAPQKPQPVVLARREAPASYDLDEEDEDAKPPVKSRVASAPTPGTPPAETDGQTVVLARTFIKPATRHDADRNDGSVAKASAFLKAPSGATKSQPLRLAQVQPSRATEWRPGDIAATLRAVKPSHDAAISAHPGSSPRLGNAAKPVLAMNSAAPGKSDKAKPAVATMQPPAKPRPVVLAMLVDGKGRPTPPPRSIAAILAVTDGKRAVR